MPKVRNKAGMSEPLILGIDIGTTHCKAALYDARGALVALHVVDTPVHPLPGGGAEYHADELWAAVCTCIRATSAALRREAEGALQGMGAIGVTSMAEAGLLLDRDGRVLTPIIAWFDPRTAAQSRWWEETLGRGTIYQISGLAVKPKSSINKVMWWRQHHPQVFAGAARWLSVADYINWRLVTGGRGGLNLAATDPTLASRTMAFDVNTGRWSERLAGHAGLDLSLFPRILPSGQPIGGVDQGVAQETGLPAGVPVAVGGHDHVCAAVAAGAAEGTVLDSAGTAEQLLVVMPRAVLGEAACRAGLSQGRYALDGKAYAVGGMNVAGGAIEWAARWALGGDVSGEERYRRLERLVDQAGPGPSGLAFLPHLHGAGFPRGNPASRAAWIGLRPDHGTPHLVKSVYEGICYELRQVADALEELLGVPIKTLRTVGGGARSRAWLRIKADVTGRSVEVPDLPEAAAYGAALLAAVGAGVYPSVEEALQHADWPVRTTLPDDAAHRAYTDFYQSVYRPLSGALAPIYQELQRVSL